MGTISLGHTEIRPSTLEMVVMILPECEKAFIPIHTNKFTLEEEDNQPLYLFFDREDITSYDCQATQSATYTLGRC